MAVISSEMLRYNRNHETCDHYLISDWSYYPSILGNTLEPKVPFFYCGKCCTHWLKGVEYNPDQWDNYVNEDENDE